MSPQFVNTNVRMVSYEGGKNILGWDLEDCGEALGFKDQVSKERGMLGKILGRDKIKESLQIPHQPRDYLNSSVCVHAGACI